MQAPAQCKQLLCNSATLPIFAVGTILKGRTVVWSKVDDMFEEVVVG